MFDNNKSDEDYGIYPGDYSAPGVESIGINSLDAVKFTSSMALIAAVAHAALIDLDHGDCANDECPVEPGGSHVDYTFEHAGEGGKLLGELRFMEASDFIFRLVQNIQGQIAAAEAGAFLKSLPCVGEGCPEAA